MNVPTQGQTSAHTPTPWKAMPMETLHYKSGGDSYIQIFGGCDPRTANAPHIAGSHYIVANVVEAGIKGVDPKDVLRANAAHIVRCVNNFEALREALEFARNESTVARGVLWSKADVAESWPDGARHAAQLRRSAEKLDEVIRRVEAALSSAAPEQGERR
jgi:hypothetical protein